MPKSPSEHQLRGRASAPDSGHLLRFRQLPCFRLTWSHLQCFQFVGGMEAGLMLEY